MLGDEGFLKRTIRLDAHFSILGGDPQTLQVYVSRLKSENQA